MGLVHEFQAAWNQFSIYYLLSKTVYCLTVLWNWTLTSLLLLLLQFFRLHGKSNQKSCHIWGIHCTVSHPRPNKLQQHVLFDSVGLRTALVNWSCFSGSGPNFIALLNGKQICVLNCSRKICLSLSVFHRLAEKLDGHIGVYRGYALWRHLFLCGKHQKVSMPFRVLTVSSTMK